MPGRMVVLAPNWLGDAVMALPLLADLRRAWPDTEIVVAARKSVAPLFAMVPSVDGTLVLETTGALASVITGRADARRLAEGAFDAALLLPNSFLAACLIWRAAIPERWGLARELRGALLTRAIRRPRHYGHQVEYYQALGAALGVAQGPPYAFIEVSPGARTAAVDLLRAAGLPDGRRFVVFAPGAAYGRAKQWPPERFAELARRLEDDGRSAVLVGAKADAAVCEQIARVAPAIDLSSRTDLATLAGVLSLADAVVANDSGAMHLAAAVGARVVAVFGSTNEQKTAPLPASAASAPASIVTAEVWCRPCMLRECPIDHRCMTRISAADVFDRVGQGVGA